VVLMVRSTRKSSRRMTVKKKSQQSEGNRDEVTITEAANEGQDATEAQASEVVEDRQSHQSNKQVAESNPKEEVESMIDEASTTPKAKAAQAVGAMFNDARVTNVLMLILVLIGMGGAEAVQSQMCSL